MSVPIITSLISAVSILLGSLLGAYCSYKINKCMYMIKCNDNKLLKKDKINYDVTKRLIAVSENAHIIRLDIATALFQCIRYIKTIDISKDYVSYIPMYNDYSKAVSSLYNAYSLEEISYLYMIYGSIDKLNYDIKINDREALRKEIILLLNRLYGDNYMKILMIDQNKINYKELYQNKYIDTKYKEILFKLDELCDG